MISAKISAGEVGLHKKYNITVKTRKAKFKLLFSFIYFTAAENEKHKTELYRDSVKRDISFGL
ncbi:MAG: hypothetical protein ACFB2Y_06005 [Fulvivirga sp.]